MARIGVAATAPFGADVLERLAANHDVAFLLTRPDRPRGRGRRRRRAAGEGGRRAARHPRAAAREARRAIEVDVADTMVVAAYGAADPDVLLERALWLNVHPSLLPRWRGAAPVERAIMAGDTETGVTIHRTTEELDAGPIAAQEAFPIGAGGRRRRRLRARRRARGRAARAACSAAPAFQPQPEEGATYAEKITAGRPRARPVATEDALDGASARSRRTSARAPSSNDAPLTVWRRARGEEGSELVVDGVELLEVQPDGRRRMTYDEFLRGYARGERLAGAPGGLRASCGACSRTTRTPTARSRRASRASTRASARSRSSSRTARCSACARSTTRSRRSAPAGAQARPARARRAAARRVPARLPRRRAGARGRERVGRARARARGSSARSRSRTRSCAGSPRACGAARARCRRARRGGGARHSYPDWIAETSGATSARTTRSR